MRTTSVINYAFSAIGLCLLLGALYLYQNTQDFLQDSITTDGTVIDVVRSGSLAALSGNSTRKKDSVTYHPVIVFETESGSMIEFKSSTGSNKKNYAKGEMVEVMYQPSSPQQARMSDFFSLWGASAILGGLGSVFFMVGFSIFFFGNRRKKKIAYLKKNGMSVEASLHSVAVNSSLKVNGKNPYQIFAQWKDPRTSTLHTFRSENIWFDPTPHIKDEKMRVLLEKNNPEKYYVDIAFLPAAID